MKKKILALIMSIVMLATFAVPAYALDLGGLLGGGSSEEDAGTGLDVEDILASDAMQDIMASDGVIDITNVVMDLIFTVGSIDIMAMGKDRAVEFVQNLIDQVGGILVDTKTNVEVFADNPLDIVDNLFGLNIGDTILPDEDEDDEIDEDELVVDLGDVDGDGKVTAADARLVLRRAALLVTFTVEQDWLADVDDDGDVTARDARIILRVAAGLEEFE